MFVADAEGNMDHYLAVGRAAIDVIGRALVQSAKLDVNKVLDLPCGGGRVTRHLVAFLPKARLFVGDINRNKVDAVAALFNAEPVDPGEDFSQPSAEHFDVIWVGSLLTHFSPWLFDRAVRWFIEALEPGGLFITTIHGRRHEYLSQSGTLPFPAQRWQPASQGLVNAGFGFVSDSGSASNPMQIGTSVCSPAWVMRLIQKEPSIRIVSFEEAGWVDAHDVLVVQKQPMHVSLP